MGMAETELRLGLPGNGGSGDARKRGFDETTVVDLKLNLSSNTAAPDQNNHKQQLLVAAANPPAKARVVGWPPVRSFRKNMMEKQKAAVSKLVVEESGGSAALVKVSMDGAPYLRKVDLRMYKTYQELSDALGNMFTNINNNDGSCGGFKDFMNEGKLMDVLNNSDYIPTYEDKDGDWMLVGDVPWEMFVESCKRLRIMKGKEALYLAPRAMEKCKNRS